MAIRDPWTQQRPNGIRTIKVIVWTGVGRSCLLEALRHFAEAMVEVADSTAEFIAALPEAKVAVTDGTLDAYSPEIAARIRESATLRWIHLMSAGYEGVAQNGLLERCLLTGPGEGVSTAVAEHAIALLWALARGLPVAFQRQMCQRWDRSFAGHAITLRGKTLLVVGFGRIGRKVAALGKAIGMRVIAVSRSGSRHANACEVHKVSSLTQLLPRADAIVATLPLSATTRRLFDERTLRYCRPGAIFVNVGRGETVDQSALLIALRQGILGAAGMDVTAPEPPAADDPLWSAERVLLTPHVGGAGDPEAVRAMAEEFAANLRRFIDGQPLRNLIHLQDLEPV